MDNQVSGKLKKLPVGIKKFKANGKEYEIEDSISFNRWNAFQLLQIELSIGLEISELVNRLKKSYSYLNQQKFADSACEIRDILIGLQQLDESRVPTAIKMCAMFINRKDEDRKIINDQMIREKYDDWAEEYDIVSFFPLALHSIPGFTKIFREDTQDISSQ